MMYRRLREGDRAGEYLLERLLLSTDSDETWAGRHHLLPRQVAVVVAKEEKGLDGLRRMGQAQHALNHPAVVKTLGISLDKNPPFLVLEHSEGRTLREVMSAEGQMAWQRAQAVMRPVLEGLGHAHESGTVHGDLRPENILVEPGGAERITGFGRRARPPVRDDLLSDSLGDDEKSAVMEAVYFPRDPDPPTPAFDVYSAGVVLFELLTGGLPHGSERPSEIVESIPARADEVFRKSYTSINLRYRDANEMLKDLMRAPEPVRHAPAEHAGVRIQIIRSLKKCPKCGAENKMEFHFCTSCGSYFEAAGRGLCVRCSKPIVAGARFCTFCGAKQS